MFYNGQVDPKRSSAQKNINQELVFKIIELKSGVDQYNVFIDNKWVLSNFSPKSNRLKVSLDKYTNVFPGDHSCRVEVSDERKNKTVGATKKHKHCKFHEFVNNRWCCIK